MFDLNFISEPGLQTSSSDASWSFLHKRVISDNNQQNKNTAKNKTIFNSNIYLYGFLFVLGLFLFLPKFYSDKPIKSQKILNQVVDLIIESGYVKDLQLKEAHFLMNKVKVTIKADKLNSIKDFTSGYRKEDKIPFQIFSKEEVNYISMKLPWKGAMTSPDITVLKSLTSKTVFSNKISTTFSDNKLELEGRSSDIISFLLQMAEDMLIEQFALSIYRLDTGRFYLLVQPMKV